jgi:hypothetical protein
MSSFKKYGGLNRSSTNNIIKSAISNNNKLNITNFSGMPNTKETFNCHIDMSGNSITNVGSIVFEDGTTQITAYTGATGQSGTSGPTGPTGPEGTIGVTGSYYGDYLYWNSSSTSWTVGTTNISLGQNAGSSNQGIYAVAIGLESGKTGQSDRTVAVGLKSGNTNQGSRAVSIGPNAGEQNQGVYAISVGNNSGYSNQSVNAVAVGNYAGNNIQGANAVAIGSYAGRSNQGSDTIAIGRSSGQTSQKPGAVAVGLLTGSSNQGNNAVALGRDAGSSNQGINAIAIGGYAGQTGQGSNAIAIGNSAGRSNQPSNSIVLNASGTVLNGITGNAFYVNPVRGATGPQSLYYDTTTKEITYSQASSSTNYWTQATDGSISANNVTINSINTYSGSIGTDVVKYDYANNSSNSTSQLQYITYYDMSYNVYYSSNVVVSTNGSIQGDFNNRPTSISPNAINDIGMSKYPDSSSNLTIACAVQYYPGGGQNYITISPDDNQVAYNQANVIISRDSGNTWRYFKITYYNVPATSIAVSQDGTHVVVGGANTVDGFIVTFNWNTSTSTWSGVATWETDKNVYSTAVAINNSYSLNNFRQTEGNSAERNMRLRNFTTPNYDGVNFIDKATRFGTTVAISKNTLTDNSGNPITSIPFINEDGNNQTLTISSGSWLCANVYDWGAYSTQEEGTFSLGIGYTNGTDYQGLGKKQGSDSPTFYDWVRINGEILYDKNSTWKMYGVDVSPDGNIILVTGGKDPNGSSNGGTGYTIPATYILVSYDYGATFNSLVYDTNKDFGRIKVIPNPITGLYDGSGSLLVYNNIDDKIYIYNNYSILHKSLYNMNVTNDINCRSLYATQKVYAAGVALTSDYRIKENVQTLDTSKMIDLSKINPVSYYNKLSNQDEYGFIAHELQETLPLLVNGEKDGESYQSVNYIGLIPILVKEIQDLKQRISILENK